MYKNKHKHKKKQLTLHKKNPSETKKLIAFLEVPISVDEYFVYFIFGR